MKKISEEKKQKIKQFYFNNADPKVYYMPFWLDEIPAKKFRAIYKLVCRLEAHPSLSSRGVFTINQIAKEDFSARNFEPREFLVTLLQDLRTQRMFHHF